MTTRELETLLRKQIPLSKAMGIRVGRVSVSRGVKFSLPLKPNRNHKNTAFGGTLVAGQALAAWSWLMALLEKSQVHAEVVVQRLSSEFLRPVNRDFSIETVPPAEHEVRVFIATLKRKHRARLAVTTRVRVGSLTAVEYRGEYVALATKPKKTKGSGA